jgi:hypothetical protein
LFIIDNCALEALFHQYVAAIYQLVFNNVCELDAASEGLDSGGMSIDC